MPSRTSSWPARPKRSFGKKPWGFSRRDRLPSRCRLTWIPEILAFRLVGESCLVVRNKFGPVWTNLMRNRQTAWIIGFALWAIVRVSFGMIVSTGYKVRGVLLMLCLCSLPIAVHSGSACCAHSMGIQRRIRHPKPRFESSSLGEVYGGSQKNHSGLPSPQKSSQSSSENSFQQDSNDGCLSRSTRTSVAYQRTLFILPHWKTRMANQKKCRFLPRRMPSWQKDHPGLALVQHCAGGESKCATRHRDVHHGPDCLPQSSEVASCAGHPVAQWHPF